MDAQHNHYRRLISHCPNKLRFELNSSVCSNFYVFHFNLVHVLGINFVLFRISSTSDIVIIAVLKYFTRKLLFFVCVSFLLSLMFWFAIDYLYAIYMLFVNCSRTKFEAVIVNMYFLQFFFQRFCASVLVHSLTFK